MLSKTVLYPFSDSVSLILQFTGRTIFGPGASIPKGHLEYLVIIILTISSLALEASLIHWYFLSSWPARPEKILFNKDSCVNFCLIYDFPVFTECVVADYISVQIAVSFKVPVCDRDVVPNGLCDVLCYIFIKLSVHSEAVSQL